MHRHLSEEEAAPQARAWAKELFAKTSDVRLVWVEFEPIEKKGKRTKKGVELARQAIQGACANGDTRAAVEAMESLSPGSDPGMALCTTVDALAAVLRERLLRGESCYVESVLSDTVVSLTVWRE